MTRPAVIGATAPLPSPGGRGGTSRLPGLQDGRERLAEIRLASRTPPGRLRLAGAVLVAVVLLFGAVAAWQASARAGAADRLVAHSQPLSQDAADIYRSLADADTTAATGFLLAGEEPPRSASATRTTSPRRPGSSPAPRPAAPPTPPPSAGYPS